MQVLFGLDWAVWQPESTQERGLSEDAKSTKPAVEAAIDEYWSKFAGERPSSFDEVRAHCAELVHGVVANQSLLDQRLQAASFHWKLDRMSAVDRNILRLGALELLVLPDKVPRKVAINEAVEIAKKFGNEDSSAFVNGILDRVANALGAEKSDKPAGAAKAAKGKAHKKSSAKPATSPRDPTTAAVAPVSGGDA